MLHFYLVKHWSTVQLDGHLLCLFDSVTSVWHCRKVCFVKRFKTKCQNEIGEKRVCSIQEGKRKLIILLEWKRKEGKWKQEWVFLRKSANLCCKVCLQLLINSNSKKSGRAARQLCHIIVVSFSSDHQSIKCAMKKTAKYRNRHCHTFVHSLSFLKKSSIRMNWAAQFVSAQFIHKHDYLWVIGLQHVFS